MSIYLFIGRFIKPITKGQFASSTKKSIQLMEKQSQALNEIITSCIHRKDQIIMNEYLPEKFEYILYIQMSELQVHSYKVINFFKLQGSSSLN